MVTRGMIPEYFLASSLASRKSEAEVVDRYQYISQRAWSPDTFCAQLEQRLWSIFFRTAELAAKGSGIEVSCASCIKAGAAPDQQRTVVLRDRSAQSRCLHLPLLRSRRRQAAW